MYNYVTICNAYDVHNMLSDEGKRLLGINTCQKPGKCWLIHEFDNMQVMWIFTALSHIWSSSWCSGQGDPQDWFSWGLEWEG